MNTLDLKQAAAFLKMHPEEIRRRARLGMVPGARPGKSWVFIEEDLAAWLRGQYTAPQPAPLALGKEQATWQPTSGAASGRSTSPRQGESALDALLRLATRSSAGASDQLKTLAWRTQQLGERPAHTWDDAGYGWLQETVHKRTHEDDIAKLAWLQQFVRGRVLAEITREEIAAIRARKKTEASDSTANRYLALVRAILRKAWLEWQWLDRAPKVKLYREPKRRIRWITREQASTLLDELPEHQRDITVFALATGTAQRAFGAGADGPTCGGCR